MAKQITIAREGYDAETETDPNRFIFHSSYNTLKILEEGVLTGLLINFDGKFFTHSYTIPGDDNTYTPMCFAFAKFPDGKICTPFSFDYSDTGKNFTLTVNEDDLIFTFSHNGVDNYNVDIKYYVFEVPLNQG